MFTFHFPAQMRGQAILNDFQRSFHPVHDWDPFNLVLQRIFPFSHFCVALSSGGGGTTKLLAQSNHHPAPSGSSSVVAAFCLLFRPRQALNEVHVPSWRELHSNPRAFVILSRHKRSRTSKWWDFRKHTNPIWKMRKSLGFFTAQRKRCNKGFALVF